MSLFHYFSNDIESLLEKLINNIDNIQLEKKDLFSKDKIIVPNRNLRKWLWLKIANKKGIAINLEFKLLQNGIIELLDELNPKKEETIRFLDVPLLQFMVIHILINKISSSQALMPFKRYLYDENEEKTKDYTKKLWQLSFRLARCFREYQFHRENMIEKWMHDQSCFTDPNLHIRDLEIAQRTIYNMIFKPGGLQDQFNSKQREQKPEKEQYLSFGQYFDCIMKQRKNSLETETASYEPIHLFANALISKFHIKLLYELSRYRDIHWYHLNPCFPLTIDWNDSEIGHWKPINKLNLEKIKIESTNETKLLNASDPLNQWGKPAIELLYLLNEQDKKGIDSQWFGNYVRETNFNQSLLLKTKHSIMHPQALHTKNEFKNHKSIQIFGSPGILREVETVYNSILYNLDQNHSLQLTDVAILVPDIKQYKPIIESVFSRKLSSSNGKTYCLTYNMTDSKARYDSVFAGAVLSLLEIAAGPLTRTDVFKLVFNPCFLHRFGITREQALVWLEWIDQLNVYHCYNREDKKSRGYYDSSAYTWKQGIMRLRFGRIMNFDSAAHPLQNQGDYKSIVPFTDFDTQDPNSLSLLSYLVEDLFHRLLLLRSSNCTAKEWKEKILTLMNDFFSIPPDRQEEERVRAELIKKLNRLEYYDDFDSEQQDNEKLSFSLFAEYIKNNISDIQSYYGSYLTGGVTISSLLPMRPIPFKIIYIMGLGEGEFPGYPDRSRLDLRNLQRQIGDLLPNEINRYLFIETLLSVKEKLYLSYISSDIQKEKEYHPSSVISELISFVNEDILKKNEEFYPIEIPSSGINIRPLTSVSNSQKMHFDIFENYKYSDQIISLMLMKDHLDKPLQKEVEEIQKENTKDFCLKETPEENQPSLMEIPLIQLHSFLKEPCEALIKYNNRLFEAEHSDKSLIQDEPFYWKGLQNYTFITNSLKHYISHNPYHFDLDHYLKDIQQTYLYQQLQNKTPEGVYAEIALNEYLQAIKSRIQGNIGTGLKDLLLQLKKSEEYHRVFLGNRIQSEQHDLVIASPKLSFFNKGVPIEVELTGQLDYLWVDKNKESMHTLVITTKDLNSGSKNMPPKQALFPFLFYLTAIVSAEDNKESLSNLINENFTFTVWVSFKNNIQYWVYKQDSIRAREYLLEIMQDFIIHKQYDLIPMVVLLKNKHCVNDLIEEKTVDQEAFKLQLIDQIKKELNTFAQTWDYNPMKILDIINPEVPEDVYIKAKKRLTPFVQFIESGSGIPDYLKRH